MLPAIPRDILPNKEGTGVTICGTLHGVVSQRNQFAVAANVERQRVCAQAPMVCHSVGGRY
jgi:hypothetical protein